MKNTYVDTKTKENFQQWNERMSIKYDLTKWYDRLLPKVVNAKKRLRLITDICRNGKIADLGCGAGQQLDLIKKKYPEAECYGFDLSGFNISRARELNSKIKWVRSDIEDIKGFGGYFDVVICSEVIEHVQHPEKVIDKVTKITKRDGQIIFSIPNMDTVDEIKSMLKKIGVHKMFPKSFSSDEWHVRDMNQVIFGKLIESKMVYKNSFEIPNSLLNLWTVYELRKCSARKGSDEEDDVRERRKPRK